MQFQQADFQRERFLDVGVQQPLDLFQGHEVLPCLPGGDPAGDRFGAGNLGKRQQGFARRQGPEPDVAQPGLDQPQEIGAAPAIFRFMAAVNSPSHLSRKS